MSDLLMGYQTELPPVIAESHGDKLDLMEGLKELRDARVEYEQAEGYYNNDMLELFVDERLRRALKATEITFRIQLAKIPVDAVAERLEIASVTVPEDEELTTVVQRIWDENQLLLESPNVHLKGCMFGDCYVIVWEGDPRTEDVDEEPSVEISYNSPLTVRVIYDDEHPLRKRFAIKEWVVEPVLATEKSYCRANLYYADRIEKWVTKPNTKGENPSDWMAWTGDDTLDDDDQFIDGSIVENPYGVIPVFHFRNGRPYGTPEHKAAYGPQDAINKLVITQMATTDFHGYPQRYVLADPQVGSDEGADFGDDDLDATESTGAISNLRSGPGRLWELIGQRAVGQFPAADPDVFLKPMAIYIRLMASVTNTPLHYFDPMGDSPSGEALRAKEAPLVKRVINRRQSFAATWSELLSFALLILGHEDAHVDVRWTAPASIDDIEGWQAQQIKREFGVPNSQLLMEGGYSEAQVSQWDTENPPQPESETDAETGSES